MKIVWSLVILSLCVISNSTYAKDNAKESYAKERNDMVTHHLSSRNIKDRRVIKAFSEVPREKFVRPQEKSQAYNDHPLPIGEGQTISQPYVVAYMTQVAGIKSGDKVLEIGTGSGYQAAILSRMTHNVYSVEIRPKLTRFAKKNMKKAGYKNIYFKTADGYDGWQTHAPYDAIVVTCAANHVPIPLKKQLKVGGKMVIPVGSTTFHQSLILITRIAEDKFKSEHLIGVRFVPMVGKAQKETPADKTPLPIKIKP